MRIPEETRNSLTRASQFSCFLQCARASFQVIFVFLVLGPIHKLISYADSCVLHPGPLPAVACLSDRVCEESTRVISEDIASGFAAKVEAFFVESLRGMIVVWVVKNLNSFSY